MTSVLASEKERSEGARRVAGSALLFLAPTVLVGGLTVVTLPYLSGVLGADGMGLLALAATVTAISGVLISLMSEAALFRRRIVEGRASLGESYGTFLAISLVMGTVLLLVAELGVWRLVDRAAGGTFWSPYGRIAFLTAWIATVAMTPIQWKWRAEERAFRFAVLKTATDVGGLLLGVAAVAWGMGVAGRLGAPLAVATVAALLLMPAFIRSVAPLRASIARTRSFLEYSLPLLPHSLAHWALALGDRVLIQIFLGVGAVGVYSTIYGILQFVEVAVGALGSAIMPVFARASRDKASWREMRRFARNVFLFATVATVALGIVLVDLILTFMPAGFHHGAGIVPYVAAGMLALLWYTFSVNAAAQTAGRTRRLPILSGLAVAVNVALNIFLLPRLGILGAGIATLVGYVALAWSTHAYARRLGFEVLPAWLAIAGVVGSTIAGLALASGVQAAPVLVRHVCSVAAAGGALASGGLLALRLDGVRGGSG